MNEYMMKSVYQIGICKQILSNEVLGAKLKTRTHLLDERWPRFPSLSCIIASPDSNCDSQSSGLTAVGLWTRWTRFGLDFCEFSTTSYAEPGEELAFDLSTGCSCVDGSTAGVVGFSPISLFVLLGSVWWCFERGRGCGSKASLSHRRSSSVADL